MSATMNSGLLRYNTATFVPGYFDSFTHSHSYSKLFVQSYFTMSLTAASLFTHAPQPEIVENIAIAPAPILPLRAIPHIENKPLSADAASVLDDIQRVLLGVETDVVGGQIITSTSVHITMRCIFALASD